MVLSVSQIKESERFTMESLGVESVNLMEKAAEGLAQTVLSETRNFELPFFVFCGPGNNGGDGLALARLLALDFFKGSDNRHPANRVVVVKCFGNAVLSPDCQANLQRLESMQLPNLKLLDFSDDLLLDNGFIVDALFGIGLSRPLVGYFADVVRLINESNSFVYAVDVPSGLFADVHTPTENPVVLADRTLTVQYRKLAFLLPENAERVGRVSLVDIGLALPNASKQFLTAKMIDKQVVGALYKAPKMFDHKGSNGFGLLIAGSYEMPGAAVLSATAAMRAGIGKVVVHTPSSVADVLVSRLPEAIVDRDSASCFSGIDLEMWSVNALAVGPGVGKNVKTVTALKDLLDSVRSPIILDADALNILADNKVWLSYLPEKSILTPHFKEFERLAGKSANDFERIDKLKDFAKNRGVIVILKGAYTAVAFPDGRLFFNTSGNPGMATAGAGDVLTGILLASLAKGYPPEYAALLSVWLHGFAADCALKTDNPHRFSCESLLASDITDFLGDAFFALRSFDDNLK